ncbi:NAD-binding protein [Fomitopsis schrenkii]|uniref:NAD-binding protein n=1 Tax=Fomitopsis schrenkii TaxID=2126942 RepID=S8FB58_FOMSC|nr:NAD-binding protein [Fomitopsis schrenkii]
MGQETNILLFGATGYVGGAVLGLFLKHPKAETFAITAPVRSPAKAKLLEQLGVKAPIASLDDHDKLESLASSADVVFNIASSDHLAGTKAILSGLRKSYEATGRRPILIHTSGTGEIAEPAEGKYATETVYSDLDVEKLKAIPDNAYHRSIDLAVISADEEGYARTYIIIPSLIYGLGSGTLFDAGIARRISIQIPTIIKASIDRKRSGLIGPGKAVWPHVHHDDVADLFITLFDTVSANPDRAGHGWEGYYFAENGHSSWYDIGKAVGEVLVELGISADPEPTSFTTEELVKYWGSEASGNYWGSTCRCSADRGRALGWKPRFTAADMLTSLMKAEVQVHLEAAQQNGGVVDFSYEKSLMQMLGTATPK